MQKRLVRDTASTENEYGVDCYPSDPKEQSPELRQGPQAGLGTEGECKYLRLHHHHSARARTQSPPSSRARGPQPECPRARHGPLHVWTRLCVLEFY